MGIKLLHTRCIVCNGRASRFFMAFQARICGRCCRRVLISDFELAWCVLCIFQSGVHSFLKSQVLWQGNVRNPSALHRAVHRQHARALFPEAPRRPERNSSACEGAGLPIHAALAWDYAGACGGTDLQDEMTVCVCAFHGLYFVWGKMDDTI